MFAKSLQLLKLILSKINVFYHILIIIVMMIIFMAVQSFISMGALNTLQQNTKELYNNTTAVGEQNKASNIEPQVEKLRSYYLAILANETSIATNLKVDPNVLFNRIMSLKNVDAAINEELTKNFADIKAIFAEPPSSTNLAVFNQAVNNIQSLVRRLRIANDNDNFNLFLSGDNLASKLKGWNLVIVIISAVIATLIGLLIAGFISNPLKRMVERVKSLETGDLSKNITHTIGSREVTQAIGGLNKAVLGLRGLVTNISEQSNILDNASTELSSVSNEAGRSATDVARAAEELASASSEQVRQITEAVDSIQKLSEIVIQVAQESERIGDASDKVAQSAELGQKVTNDVAVEINALFDSTKEVAEVINMLISTSDEISGITSIIEGIAEQTSLLALNASIEAARAGEHGKGFAVVARETSKLAEQSKQSTRMISELIMEMKARTDHAVEVMQQGITRAEAGKNLAEEATVTFREIYKAIMSTVAEIDLVVKSTKQMAVNNDKATEAITAISAISEQNLASTEEVSAFAEEQSAAIEEVSAMAHNLAGIAGSLKQAVEKFQLG